MLTDPISDLLVRLRNGSQRRHDTVSVPASKLKRAILELLKQEGYVYDIADAVQDAQRLRLPAMLMRCHHR